MKRSFRFERSLTEAEWAKLATIAATTLIMLSACLAYSNAYFVPFIYDDLESIAANPHIRHLWPVVVPPQTALSGRPLVSFSLALNYAVSGLGVWSYHLFNLIIHVANALLLFAILRRTPRVTAWIAVAAALTWAVHPVNTEAVTYITQRTELLAAFFLLLTLYCTIRSAQARHRNFWIICAIVSCLCGTGAKEIIAAAPIVVLAYDVTFLQDIRERRGLYAGLFLTWAIIGATLYSGSRSESAGFGLSIHFWDYLKTQSGVIVYYLRLAFWPHPLVIDYSDWPIATRLVSVLPQALMVVALIGVSLWQLWKREALGALGLWFFAILAPTSSFVPIITEPAAERRMYLPLMAVTVLVVYSAYRFLGRTSSVLAFCLIVPSLAAVTYARNADYRSEIAIWEDAVQKRPNNPKAHQGLGLALVMERRFDEALTHFLDDARLAPSAKAQHNLGAVYSSLQQHDEAVKHYRAALEYNPKLVETRWQLAREYFLIGDSASGERELALVKKIDPSYERPIF